jgi:N-acetylmuramoyl-L-alanine amidase
LFFAIPQFFQNLFVNHIVLSELQQSTNTRPSRLRLTEAASNMDTFRVLFFWKNLPARSVLAALLCFAGVVGWMLLQGLKKNPASPDAGRAETPTIPYRLSPLGKVPDWSCLNAYHGTMTRDDFAMALQTVFTCSPAWEKYFTLNDDHVMIQTVAANPESIFRLEFARTSDEEKAAVRSWRSLAEMDSLKPGDLPLRGVHIAIDAAHIGGSWAQMEERWFRIGDATPVTEGDMTLRVAHLLRPALEDLGAKVSLVRETPEPLTEDRPERLLQTMAAEDSVSSQALISLKQAEMLFYRTSEIRARAEKVNHEIRPDITLCLHFNAVGWGDPANPQLVEENHFHILLNGAYTDDELDFDDQRLDMTRKILQRTIDEEAALGAVMARVFAEQTQLPAHPYESDSNRARNVNGNPYLWARNLIANRLYDCPVIFFEPYVMNSIEFHERIQLGDYDGIKEVAGKARLSIYREYCKAVVDGLVEYYKQRRTSAK